MFNPTHNDEYLRLKSRINVTCDNLTRQCNINKYIIVSKKFLSQNQNFQLYMNIAAIAIYVRYVYLLNYLVILALYRILA